MLYTNNSYLRVILVDDMARELSQTINRKIQGVNLSERFLTQGFIDRLQKDGYQLSDKVLWCFDATYRNEDIDVSALDVAELLISWYPKKASSVVVLIGADVNEYYQQLAGNGDYNASVFLSRIRALPHVIYGGKHIPANKTKEESIINSIRTFSIKSGFEIENRMPSGEVSPEILETAKTTMENLKKIKNLISSSIGKNVVNVEPKSEEERVLINLIKTADHYFHQHCHDLSNVMLMLSQDIKRAEGTIHKDERQKQ